MAWAGTMMGNIASAIGVPAEDAALVSELKAGSEEAFAMLIAQYHQPLYSLIARSLPNPVDAADITQDVFVKVFRSIRSFNGDSSLRTWIYRIALHESSNQKRWWSRHKKQEVTIDADLSDDGGETTFCLSDTLADTGDSPYDRAAQSEVRERVEEALRQVPETFRTVVILREIEGMAYDEIAEILNINMGTVKSRLLRGRAALRTLLTGQIPPVNRKPSQSESLPGSYASKESAR
jgi:RNA polymerase sigma-70 factor, ECF subfamily